jgi:hypothetical protein
VGFNTFQNLIPIDVPVVGNPGVGTDTFDASPNTIRFYSIDGNIRHARPYFDPGFISDIDPTPIFDSDTVLTFEYTVYDGGSPTGQEFTVICAIATN